MNKIYFKIQRDLTASKFIVSKGIAAKQSFDIQRINPSDRIVTLDVTDG